MVDREKILNGFYVQNSDVDEGRRILSIQFRKEMLYFVVRSFSQAITNCQKEKQFLDATALSSSARLERVLMPLH